VVATGTNAMMARFIGAGDREMAARVAGQALLFSLGFSVAIAAIGISIRPLIFRLMGTAPDVTAFGRTYLLILFAAAPLFCVSDVFAAMFRASGDTKTPLVVYGCATALNMALDPLLIFGVGPFPRLGVAGAGLAMLSFGLLSLPLMLYFLRRRPVPFRLAWRFDPGLVWRIARIGIPASVSGILFSVVYVFLTRITSSFGTEALAALGIGNRIESINYMTSFGFETATATMVGQNLGAGDTVPPMLVSVPLSILRLPVALVLSGGFGLGADSVWWAISSTSIVKGALMAVWFKAGRWKNKKV
jgi:putative MATE family efflux protein